MDNLNIRGIEDDKPRRRGKKRRGRKPFVLETRWVPGPNYIENGLKFLFERHEKWSTYSRYHTESARDSAYAALVKKETVSHTSGWVRAEYRKRDD